MWLGSDTGEGGWGLDGDSLESCGKDVGLCCLGGWGIPRGVQMGTGTQLCLQDTHSLGACNGWSSCIRVKVIMGPELWVEAEETGGERARAGSAGELGGSIDSA